MTFPVFLNSFSSPLNSFPYPLNSFSYPRAVLETSGTVFPIADRPRPVNNTYVSRTASVLASCTLQSAILFTNGPIYSTIWIHWVELTLSRPRVLENFVVIFEIQTYSANVFTSLLRLNSDQVIIHYLGGYNCCVCTYFHAIS